MQEDDKKTKGDRNAETEKETVNNNTKETLSPI